jgi:hypothetical protein
MTRGLEIVREPVKNGSVAPTRRATSAEDEVVVHVTSTKRNEELMSRFVVEILFALKAFGSHIE